MIVRSVPSWLILMLHFFESVNCFLSSPPSRQRISSSSIVITSYPPSKSNISTLSSSKLAAAAAREEEVKRLLIFGNGNVANEIGNYVSEANDGTFDTIFSTYRNSNGSNSPPSSNNKVEFINFDHASDFISECTHVLITIPPSIQNSSGFNFDDPVSDDLELMRSIPKNVTIGYVSTTGVYGNHNNSFVNEASPILCKLGTKAFAYREIEKRWQQLQTRHDDADDDDANASNRNIFIFRCAGLYGNNFSALHTVWNRGIPKPELKPEPESTRPMAMMDEGYTSRVHLKDVARAIVATMKRTDLKGGGIYNLSDSAPAPRSQVMNYAKELLSQSNVSTDGRETGDIVVAGSERRKRRNKDRKRVSNDAMKEMLRDEGGLLYPTYREGLQEVLANNIDQWKAMG